MDDAHWLNAAIEQARAGIARGQSPFGAVIVREGRLIAAGHNEVRLRTDPTAHAETVCIARASAAVGSIDLSGCVLYSTCEPCPMCAAAIHWARLDRVVYGATIADAAGAGFNELSMSIDELYARGGSRTLAQRGPLADRCAALFSEWRAAGTPAY